MGRLDGKVCFVTGAGSGIGAKTAELFAHEGASVIMADMHEENLNKVAANIRAAGGEVMTAVVNITDNDAVKAAFAAGVEKYGKIDALANIAGVLDVAMRPIDDFLTSDLDTTLTVNVKGTMYVTRAAVKQFIAQGYGTIATVASVGGVNGNGSAAYTVSKGAEVALTKHIALRFANGEQKIRANCVCPGTVMTPMTTRAMKARGKYTKAAKAMQASTAKHSTLDVGTCSDLDIAKILLFLCSDDSAPLNGQALVADYGANLLYAAPVRAHRRKAAKPRTQNERECTVMSNRLEGKVALVTACTRGIGRAIADLFVDEGAKVYYACRNMETGKAAVEAARARGGQAELVYFEAHDPATHRSMIDECIAKEGRLDVLVNNFGESNPRKDLDITKCTYKEFEKTVCVDLSTVFNACQEALNKAMIKQHSGSIINIGSVAAVCPDRTQVGYGVAKSGINHLSRQMARQVAHAGVRVNVLNPGIIATEAVAKHLTPETQSRYTTNCMIKHLGEPIDIAYMALYLASDESKYVTAHVMNVSGGWM